jgi:hypothetical protein
MRVSHGVNILNRRIGMKIRPLNDRVLVVIIEEMDFFQR